MATSDSSAGNLSTVTPTEEFHCSLFNGDQHLCVCFGFLKKIGRVTGFLSLETNHVKKWLAQGRNEKDMVHCKCIWGISCVPKLNWKFSQKLSLWPWSIYKLLWPRIGRRIYDDWSDNKKALKKKKGKSFLKIMRGLLFSGCHYSLQESCCLVVPHWLVSSRTGKREKNVHKTQLVTCDVALPNRDSLSCSVFMIFVIWLFRKYIIFIQVRWANCRVLISRTTRRPVL